MGMDQYLSGVVALPSTTYDEKTDSRNISPTHQRLRDLCNITAPFHISGGPVIFFPLMTWHNDETIHNWFINTRDKDCRSCDSGDKFWVSFQDFKRFYYEIGSKDKDPLTVKHLAAIIAYQTNPDYETFDGLYYEADW